MNLFGALVIFVIGFWLVLFAIISRGITTYADLDAAGIEHDSPADPSSPVDHGLWRKMLIAAVGGLVLVALVWLGEKSGFFGWLIGLPILAM